MILESLDSIDQTIQIWCHGMSHFANHSLLSISWGDVQTNSITSAKKLVPSLLISCQWSTSAPIPHHEASADKSPQIELEVDDEALIGIPEMTQDSYWQYYEDCDRWNVDFADLLLESDSAVRSREIVEEAIEQKSPIEGISPPCLLVRIVAAQNASNWLYRRPRIKKPAHVNVSRWMGFVKSCYVATVLVMTVPEASATQVDRHELQWRQPNSGLAQRYNLVSAGWRLVSEIVNWARADHVFTRVSSNGIESTRNH